MNLRKAVVRAIKEYDPNQPRVAHGPNGGQWVKVDAVARLADFPQPPALRSAVDRLAARGFKTYAVGGAIRDFLLGKTPHDIDLATDARPEQTKSVFAGQVKFDAGGEAHGTVRVESGFDIYEITTLRHDEETDGKHAKVRWTTSVVDDLQRRDLTINALALDLSTGKLYGPGPNGDPAGALADLKNRVVRFVGNGRKRILEDYSRALRLVRFAVKMNATIDPASLQAVKDTVAAGEIPNPRLAHEEVRNEFLKTLSFPSVGRGLRLWKDTGLLYAYFPELAPAEHQSQNHHHGDVKVLEHIFRTVEAVDLPDRVDTAAFEPLAREIGVTPREAGRAVLRLTMLMHDVGKPRTAAEKPDTPGEYSFIGHEHVGADMAREIGRRLVLPTRMVDLIADSVDEHMAVPHPGTTDNTIRRWARKVGERFKVLREQGLDPVEWLLAVRAGDWGAQGRERVELDTGADAIRTAIAAVPVTSKPPVDGATVMRLTGLKPGREVGQIVRGIGDFLDNNPAADQAAIEAEVLRLHRQR